jgi:anthranilate phosphoribosyltransferase
MSLKPILARLADGARLTEAEAEEAFGIIMAGEATPAQIAGMLMAMRVRGETVAEMTGAVRAMRARMVAIEAPPGRAWNWARAPSSTCWDHWPIPPG